MISLTELLIGLAGVGIGIVLAAFVLGGGDPGGSSRSTQRPTTRPPTTPPPPRPAPPLWLVKGRTPSHSGRTLRIVMPMEHARARVMAQVKAAIDAITSVQPRGRRRAILHACCYALGQSLDAAGVSVDKVAPELEAAARAAGQDPEIIRGALEAGRRASELEHG